MDKIGLVEKVKIIGDKVIKTEAKIDTGAARSCVDYKLAAKAKLGPVVSSVRVLSGSNTGEKKKHYIRRPIVKAKIEINDNIYDVRVSLEDREHLQFPVIIGRNLLKDFVVDVGDEDSVK